jgi:hypothetical protein
VLTHLVDKDYTIYEREINNIEGGQTTARSFVLDKPLTAQVLKPTRAVCCVQYSCMVTNTGGLLLLQVCWSS